MTLEGAPEKPDTPIQSIRERGKIKVLTVPLDPITSDKPQFAQLAIPIPISDEQKKRLINFLQNL